MDDRPCGNTAPHPEHTWSPVPFARIDQDLVAYTCPGVQHG